MKEIYIDNGANGTMPLSEAIPMSNKEEPHSNVVPLNTDIIRIPSQQGAMPKHSTNWFRLSH